MTDKEKQEFKEKILNKVLYRARERIGGFPIDENILEDICNSIRVDKNI